MEASSSKAHTLQQLARGSPTAHYPLAERDTGRRTGASQMPPSKLDVWVERREEVGGNSSGTPGISVGDQLVVEAVDGCLDGVEALAVRRASGEVVGSVPRSRFSNFPGQPPFSATVRSVQRLQDGSANKVQLRIRSSPESELPAGEEAGSKDVTQEENMDAMCVTTQMLQNLELRPILRDERLQEVINRIDAAPNRAQALAASLSEDEAFGRFCNKVLTGMET